MRISIHDVDKQFGSFTALDRINLDIRSGELVALLGPSGSGKTTLLRIIAGLDWPDAGEVRFDGQDALARTVGERQVGFVFQHYALFRHMTISENIAFGLRAKPRRHRPNEQNIRSRVGDLIDLVQLNGLAERYPTQLSGGQRQRVALARALAVEPRVLLLDEPFGALDAKVRKELRRWLRQLHTQIQVTSVFVTHDQEEALEVADRVVVLDKGHIEQAGTPEQIYEQPANAFVHAFIGESISLPVSIQNGNVIFAGQNLEIDAGEIDGEASLFIRPYEIDISSDLNSGNMRGLVTRVQGLGASRRIEVTLSNGKKDHLIEIAVPRDSGITPGQIVGLRPQAYKIFGN